MKKLITIIGAAAFMLAAVSVSRADVNQTTLDKIIGQLGGATNWAVEPYFTYAPKSPGSKLGGGMLAVYDVSQNVGIGLGLDWLGQLSLVSANVTLQLPFHPLPNQFPQLELSPFVLGAVGSAYSGSGNFNGAVATIEDVGAYIRIGHMLGGQFNVGGCYGQWTGVGKYDVKRAHLFAGMSWGF